MSRRYLSTILDYLDAVSLLDFAIHEGNPQLAAAQLNLIAGYVRVLHQLLYNDLVDLTRQQTLPPEYVTIRDSLRALLAVEQGNGPFADPLALPDRPTPGPGPHPDRV